MPKPVISAMQMFSGNEIELPPEFAKSLRRADNLTKNVVGTTVRAFQEVGKNAVPADQTGVFFGTSLGPLETNLRFLDTLLDDGEGQASPTLFSHSVHNAATGYLTRIFNIYGPAFAFTSYAWPFLTALQQAVLSISSGAILRAIVVAGEMNSPLVDYSARQLTKENYDQGSQGAVTWIIESCQDRIPKNSIAIKGIDINEKPCTPSHFLTRTEERIIFDGCEEKCPAGIMAYAFLITSLLKKRSFVNKMGEVLFSAEASFGKVSLHLSF